MLGLFNVKFEIIFISEGKACIPAAEIQFNGQRLCIVRYPSPGSPQIEFVQDLYVGRNVHMIFPLADFQETVQIALGDLAAWLEKLEAHGTEG